LECLLGAPATQMSSTLQSSRVRSDVAMESSPQIPEICNASPTLPRPRSQSPRSRIRRTRSDFQSPQTVLRTAGRASTAVRRQPPNLSQERGLSLIVRPRPLPSAALAVFLAVGECPGIHGTGSTPVSSQPGLDMAKKVSAAQPRGADGRR